MRLITLAIHTFDRATALKNLLEHEGVKVQLQNVNLEHPSVSSGVRVRIHETDLPLALRIVENIDIFATRDFSETDDEHAIVVPVDFSDNSLNSVQVAFELAQQHQMDIKLLHTYIDPRLTADMQLKPVLNYEIGDKDFKRQLENTAKTRMMHFADRLREMMKAGLLPLVKFTTSVVEGVPEDSIVEYAKENPPYMIVMGTRSSAQKEVDMIGSVAAEVLDKSRCSVLTIPATSNLRLSKNINTIVFFTNLEQEDILAIDTMARIFNQQSCKVLIVPVPSKKQALDFRNTEDEIRRMLDYCKVNFPRFTFGYEVLQQDRHLSAYRNLFNNSKIDVLVVPHKRKNVFSRFFNPGLAHKILLNADIPMLVIRV